MESDQDWGADPASGQAHPPDNDEHRYSNNSRSLRRPFADVEPPQGSGSNMRDVEAQSLGKNIQRDPTPPRGASALDIQPGQDRDGNGDVDDQPLADLSRLANPPRETSLPTAMSNAGQGQVEGSPPPPYLSQWLEGIPDNVNTATPTGMDVDDSEQDKVGDQGRPETPALDIDQFQDPTRERDDMEAWTRMFSDTVAQQEPFDDTEDIELSASTDNPRQGAASQQQIESHPFALRLHHNYGQTQILSIQTPEPFAISIHDSTIKCICPPGTTRLAKDLIFARVAKNGVGWTHLSCKPYTASVPAAMTQGFASFVNSSSAAGAAFDAQGFLAQLLGHSLNEKQQLFAKHFSSTYICDGPCSGPKPLPEFFMCKKCCAWQHKTCMLYGEEHDRNGPVCNRCYQLFMMRREEIEQWQRKRLLMAVKEAWDYLNNPENRHQEWRRAFIRQWLARFFAHNQGVFHKYLAAKRHADRIAEAQSYYSRVKTLEQILGEDEDDDPQAAAPHGTVENGKKERRKPTRDKPKRKSAPVKLLLESGDVDMEDADQREDDAGSDEIVVATKKSKNGKSKAQTQSVPTGNGARKRKALSPLSSPLTKKSKSRAPRKSAPGLGMFGRANDQDDDEEELDNQPLQQVSRPRRDTRPPAKISCVCGGSPAVNQCFKCRDCGTFQHKGCADDIQDGLSVCCNFCYTRGPLPSASDGPKPMNNPFPPAFQAPMPPPAPTAPAPPMQPTAEYDQQLRLEVEQLCATVLWREYCSLPDPDPEDDVPPAPTMPLPALPPASWLSECQERLLKLFVGAGQQKTAAYLHPVLASFPRQNHQIMRAVRELALEEIRSGSMKGRRRQLGVLLEVLGLEEKGRMWKGLMGRLDIDLTSSNVEKENNAF